MRFQHFDPTAWLEENAAGYKDLSKSERRTIADFCLIWSLMEHKLSVESNSNVPARIIDTLEAKQSEIDLNKLREAVKYFSTRYYEHSSLNEKFRSLHLSPRYAPLVEAVLSGAETMPHKILEALLLIAHRLRNNLLHGEKWAYGIKGQRENFQHSTDVVISFLESLYRTRVK